MIAKDIEESLEADGYDIRGVIAWPSRGEFIVVDGPDDLPETVEGLTYVEKR